MAGNTTSTTTLTLHTGATLWRGKGSLQAGRRLSQQSSGSIMWTTSTSGHSIIIPALQGVCSGLHCCIPFHFSGFCFASLLVCKSQVLCCVSVYASVPRYDQPPPLPPPVTYQPRPTERNQPVLVPANPYHTAEIPDWLQVYARAPLK